MLIDSALIESMPLSAHDSDQLYNGLDNCITLEVMEHLQAHHGRLPDVYSFSLAMQAPALEMMLRGWKIDNVARNQGVCLLQKNLERLDFILQQYAQAIWERPLNPRSPKQLLEFFYKSMGLPEQWISQKGVRKLSTNRETLEKLEVYYHAKPVIAVILAYRDTAKQLEVLNTAIDSDSRWRTSYNIGGTETGRWSSSASAEGTGSNIQNINPVLRTMFVADPGFVLFGIDLEQTESRDVGWLCGTLFNDWGYLDACEAGDLHTTVCKLVWPELKWTGDRKADRLVAEQPFYRHFTYRDMAKRGGHGSNYLGTAFTMARHLKVDAKVIQAFQTAYFKAFPGIPEWHAWTARQLQTTSQLVTPFGRSRTFFGRVGDDTTLREAVAFVPQSTTADRLNLGLWRVWKEMGREVQLLGQVHDAIYFQIPETANIPAAVERVLALLETPLFHTLPNGSVRSFIVPGEAKWGWNWGSASPKNPDGLTKWKGSIDRSRTPLLDRRL